MKSAIYLILAVCFAGCTFILWEPAQRTYIIPKGQHTPIQPIGTRLLKKPTKLIVTVTLDSSCIYEIGEINQADINKIWGFGFVGIKNQGLEAAHRVDSFRFGWRWYPARQQFEIVSYVYDAGKRLDEKILKRVSPNVPVTLSVLIDYERGEYQTEGVTIPFSHRKSLAYVCGPFFGGNVPAPHTMFIKIQD